MEKYKVGSFSLACMLTASGFSTLPTVAKADDVCQILARNLRPDSLLQSGYEEKFSQLQQLVSNSTYASWANASNSTLNGSIDIPGEVDAALATTSNALNWGQNRSKFLSMNYEEAAARSGYSSRLSHVSVNALQAISDCAQSIANQNGFFANVQAVSDNRDSFSVLLKHSTTGSADWSLKTFAVNPPDNKLKCTDNAEKVSSEHPMKLTEQTKVIGCSKDPRKSLLLTVQTTAGAAPTTFALESVDEQISKLKADFTQTMSQLSNQIAKVNKPDMVAAFASNNCPSGWGPYVPAEGRFIRGIDPSGTVDPDGHRAAGSLQGDALRSHYHTMGINGADTFSMAVGGATQRMPNFVNDPFGGGVQKKTDNTGGPETRPNNVALMYCVLN